jgi:hypothetical protein
MISVQCNMLLIGNLLKSQWSSNPLATVIYIYIYIHIYSVSLIKKGVGIP